MALQQVNFGSASDGSQGDTARAAFGKINQNFSDTTNAASRLVGTASGNVMEVGAFGLGSTDGRSAGDANAVNLGGSHALASGASNNPFSTPAVLQHTPYNNGGSLQIAASLTSGQRLIWRTQASGTYSAWQEVARLASPDFIGSIKVAGPAVISSADGLRHINGNYGAFWRNDGSNLYLMLTNSGDQNGTYNSLRPLYVGLSSGRLTMGQGFDAQGACAFSAPMRPAQYTIASLPSASAFNGYEIDVTDAAGGPKRCRSDGTSWKILNTTTTVS